MDQPLTRQGTTLSPSFTHISPTTLQSATPNEPCLYDETDQASLASVAAAIRSNLTDSSLILLDGLAELIWMGFTAEAVDDFVRDILAASREVSLPIQCIARVAPAQTQITGWCSESDFVVVEDHMLIVADWLKSSQHDPRRRPPPRPALIRQPRPARTQSRRSRDRPPLSAGADGRWGLVEGVEFGQWAEWGCARRGTLLAWHDECSRGPWRGYACRYHARQAGYPPILSAMNGKADLGRSLHTRLSATTARPEETSRESRSRTHYNIGSNQTPSRCSPKAPGAASCNELLRHSSIDMRTTSVDQATVRLR